MPDSTFPQNSWYSLVLSQIPQILYKLLRSKPTAVPKAWCRSSGHPFWAKKVHLMDFCLYPYLTFTVWDMEGCPLNEFFLYSLDMLISISSHSRKISQNILQSISCITYSWNKCGPKYRLKKILKRVLIFTKQNHHSEPTFTYMYT